MFRHFIGGLRLIIYEILLIVIYIVWFTFLKDNIIQILFNSVNLKLPQPTLKKLNSLVLYTSEKKREIAKILKINAEGELVLRYIEFLLV